MKLLKNSINHYWISGAYSEGEYDTSLIGGIAQKLGVKRNQFLSGNCVAINLKKFIPYFPNIYNEDWLAFLPAVHAKRIALVGSVFQLERRVKDINKTLSFQEFGEIIADSLYHKISNQSTEVEFHLFIKQVNTKNYWETILQKRLDWFDEAEKRLVLLEKKQELDCIKKTKQTLINITPESCCEFVTKWLTEYTNWGNKLN